MKIAFKRYLGDDREELLESQAAERALKALLGERLVVCDRYPEDVTHAFGRPPKNWFPLPKDMVYPGANERHTPYWEWEGFLANARRSVTLCDFEGAGKRTAEIHAAGKDAFAKTTWKSWSGVIRQGQTFGRAIGDAAYIYIDRPPCLLVQERVRIEHEYRIFIVDGNPVTGAGALMEMTPNDNESTFDCKVRKDIRGDDVAFDPAMVAEYVIFAREAVKRMPVKTIDMDVAMIDGEIGIVEVNPLHLGQVGLFASDVDALAQAVCTSLKLI